VQRHLDYKNLTATSVWETIGQTKTYMTGFNNLRTLVPVNGGEDKLLKLKCVCKILENPILTPKKKIKYYG
jgi:hypothetical protein